MLHYVCSKGAVVAMSRAMAREVGDDNICVNTLAPGLTLSPAVADADQWTEQMVATMKPGAVIVDLAVEVGGNCPLTKLDQVVKTKNGVTIIGHGNVAGRLAEDASALFAKNLLNFITPLVDPETKNLAIDWEDEIVKGTLVTRDGKVVHPMLTNKKPRKKPAGKAKKPASKPKPKRK